MGIIDGVGGKVGDRGYHSLIDNVKDRQIQDEHFQDFFDLAMDEIHEWPRKESTREENMKQLANCSWMVIDASCKWVSARVIFNQKPLCN